MREYPENMNLKTAAKYLGVPAATVQRLLENYEIPAAKIGRHWLFKKSVIDEWLVVNSWSRLKARSKTNASRQPTSVSSEQKKEIHPSVARLFAAMDNFDFSGLDPADWDDAQKLIADDRKKSMEKIEKIARWAESDE